MEDGWEDPQGLGAHQARLGEGLGLTAHVPGPWTPSPPVPTGTWCLLPSALQQGCEDLAKETRLAIGSRKENALIPLIS